MREILLLAAATMLVAAKHGAPDTPLLLNAGNLDAALVLPVPPSDNSALGKAELAQLHVIDRTRTPEEVAQAQADGATKNVSIFAGIMGPGFDLDQQPATKALFHTVCEEEKAAADRAKDQFRRNRPWITDPSLHACAKDDKPQSSHTSMGFAMASILARLAPTKAPAIMGRAAEYAHGRLVCEVHSPGDVTAGQAFGMIIAERLMEQAAFRVQFEAARRELTKSGLIS